MKQISRDFFVPGAAPSVDKANKTRISSNAIAGKRCGRLSHRRVLCMHWLLRLLENDPLVVSNDLTSVRIRQVGITFTGQLGYDREARTYLNRSMGLVP